MCPNREFFVVRIFLYSDLTQENTDQKNPYLDTFHAVFILIPKQEYLSQCFLFFEVITLKNIKSGSFTLHHEKIFLLWPLQV